MISAINSSDKKRHMALASTGGLAWGGKEVYNTFSKIKESKDLYKNLMIGFYYGHEKDFEQNLRQQNLPEAEINERTARYKKIRKEQIETFKHDCRTEVKKIKKYAPLKITAKTFGGAAIGFGLSHIYSNIKSDK